jgi:endonuclease/exonuclease/phosphatase family metal-dependent hydrolase
MPYYFPLLQKPLTQRRPIIQGLQRLRAGFRQPGGGSAAPIPERDLRGNLLLATWNLREFDSGKGGRRLDEAIWYIAEIIDQFDLVALQEVREDLDALHRLLFALGKHWDFICTDVTLGHQGNGERMAFVYDTRKVRFTGLAGELVLPREFDSLQFARTPFVTSWQAGWAKFALCTVHILYGDDRPDEPRRLQEIAALANLLGKRTRQRLVDRGGLKVKVDGENLVLLGDFNIFARNDATMQALTTDSVFEIPVALQSVPGSNVQKNKLYDQIACGAYKFRFEPTPRAGVFDFYEHVFRDADAPRFDALRGRSAFRTWRTHQMSDHLLMWQEFRIDFANDYLAQALVAKIGELPE